jgi:catechol 2,3-dioxygenase-like lactoylglutathione lyase family enzyme
VGIVVADVDAAVDALTRTLGLAVTFRADTQVARTAFLAAGSARLELIEFLDADLRTKRLPVGRLAHIEHLAFEVTDVDGTFAEFQRLGIAAQSTPFNGGPFRTFFTAGTETAFAAPIQVLQSLGPGHDPTDP